MKWMRRRIRAAVIAWLVCQVAAVSAVPLRDCCQDHERPKAAAPSCHGHDAARPAPECPMKAAGGAACPMHGSPSSPASGKTCVLKGRCDAQAATLASIFFVPGIVPELIAIDAPDQASAHRRHASEPAATLPTPPEPPPPRPALAI